MFRHTSLLAPIVLVIACDHGDSKPTADFSGVWTCKLELDYKFSGQVDKKVEVESTRTNVQHGAKLESTGVVKGIRGCVVTYSIDGNVAVIDPGQTCTVTAPQPNGAVRTVTGTQITATSNLTKPDNFTEVGGSSLDVTDVLNGSSTHVVGTGSSVTTCTKQST